MPSSGGGCMHIDEDKVNPVSFATYLGEGGYTVGYFGKHLNNCPATPPPGFDCPTCKWFANGGDTAPGGQSGGYYDSAFFDYDGAGRNPSPSPLATDNLLENINGVLQPHPLPRDGGGGRSTPIGPATICLC